MYLNIYPLYPLGRVKKNVYVFNPALCTTVAPVCLETQQAVYGGGKNEHLNVSCAVHAHPPPSAFRYCSQFQMFEIN